MDVMTAYVISGGAALAAAAILGLAESPRPEIKRALRILIAAVLLMGVCIGTTGSVGLWATALLEQPLPAQASPEQLLHLCAGTGILLVAVLVAWGLGLMVDQPTHRYLVPLAMVSSLVLMPATYVWAPHALVDAFACGLAGGSLLVLWQVRKTVRAPDTVAARMVGLMVASLAISALLRAGWTLAYTGPIQLHMLHVPAAAMPFYALFYAGLPTVLASLLLVMLNGQLLAQLRHRAAVDELTGALTRRALREQAAAHISHTHSSRRAVAVFMLDIDHFKRVNDQHGHAVGDRVLRQVGALLREHLRPDCLLARYGGEEFVALVPVSDVQGARVAAERLRKAIADADWSAAAAQEDTTSHSNASGPLSPTISLGVTLLTVGEALDDALLRADQALYRAKREGRNQVQMALEAA
jgi:diguanylate cyclase (GGDEF)-like protein